MNEILCRGQCRQAVFLLAHKSFVILLIAILSPQKTAWELFIFWLQGNQSFSDKLRFRSQKFGNLMFRVAGAYVPNFFRISFETEPRLFFFLRPWLKVAAPLQLFFFIFFFFRDLRLLTLNTFAGFWTWKTGQAGIFKLSLF